MTIFTIGHSNQSIEDFINLLRPFNINCIIDVRSAPYSKYTPQFNQTILQATLQQHNILYVHFGQEFGARRTDCLLPATFTRKGRKPSTKLQVNFEAGTQTPDFLHGVERLTAAVSQGYHVCLMCSEADPLACHRFSFIARYFHDNGWDIRHIVNDKEANTPTAIPHITLEQQMIQDYVANGKLQPIDGLMSSLFSYTADTQRTDAYHLKNKDIGYIPDEDTTPID